MVDNNKVVVVLVKGHPFKLTTVSILKMIFKARIISLAKKDIEIQPGFEPGSSEFQSDATLQIKTPFNIIISLLEDIFVFMRNLPGTLKLWPCAELADDSRNFTASMPLMHVRTVGR